MKRTLRSAIAGLLIVACGAKARVVPPNAVIVGALLPFTGNSAASGANVERALILLEEQLNALGGLGGRPVHVVARDTHSRVDLGIEALSSLTDKVQAAVILGPEESDLAAAVTEVVEARGVVHMAVGVTEPIPSPANNRRFTFHVAPSPINLAAALAKRMRDDGKASIGVVYSDDAYGQGFSQSVIDQFGKRGGDVVTSVAHPTDPRAVTSIVPILLAKPFDALVVVSGPSSGAQLVENISDSGHRLPWYFGPSLKTGEFVQNTSPGVVDGGVGVAFKLSNDATLFAGNFQKRWNETPLTEAYFYYDAMLLWAVGYAAAAASGATDAANVVRQIPLVSKSGVDAPWYDLEQVLSLVKQGSDIDLRGVTGSLDLDESGTVGNGLVTLWEVQEAKVVDQSTVAAAPL